MEEIGKNCVNRQRNPLSIGRVAASQAAVSDGSIGRLIGE